MNAVLSSAQSGTATVVASVVYPKEKSGFNVKVLQGWYSNRTFFVAESGSHPEYGEMVEITLDIANNEVRSWRESPSD